MNSFLDDLTLEQLDGDSRELAEVIGMDAFKNSLKSTAVPALCIFQALQRCAPGCATKNWFRIIKRAQK